MLRSFDYAAAAVDRAMTDSDADGVEQRAYRAREWAERNRDAFCDGYTQGRELTARRAGPAARVRGRQGRLRGVYEARNRPSWLPIPLGADREAGRP